MNSSVPTRTHPLLRRLLLAALATSGLLAGALLYLGLVGVAVDGSLYRRPLEKMLSEQLGRPVSLAGGADLYISLKPALKLRDFRIAQPEGFDGKDFVSVGELRVELDLWPLIHRQFKAETLSASGVKIHLKQRADGSNNWTFPALDEDSPSSSDVSADDDADNALLRAHAAGIDIRQIRLRDLDVEFRGVNDKPFFFALDKLDARVPVDAALQATAEGSVDNTMPYAIRIDGGRLRDLMQGKPDWPLTMQLQFAGGLMTVNGVLSPADTQLRFGLGTPDLARFGRIVGMTLPNAGAAGVAGSLQINPGQVAIRQLSATMGKSVMTGDLQVDMREERPRLSGALSLPALDLRPFLGQEDEEEPPTDFRALYLSLSRARLDLQQLNQYDADLSLSVDRWLSLPGDIRQASLRLKLNAGKLTMPVQTTIASVPLKGELAVDASSAVPSFQISVGADNAGVGNLAQMLTGLPGIEGRLGRLTIALSSRGNNGQTLMKKLASRLEISNSRLSYGNVSNGKPVSVVVDRMRVELPGESALTGSFKGQLLGKPLEATLRGSDLISIVRSGTSPIEFIVNSGRISARVAGMLDAARNQAQLQFSLGAVQAGEVAAWLGLSPEARGPVALAGQLRMAEDQWQLSNMVFQLGQSSVYAELSRSVQDGKPLVSGKLEAAAIHLNELEAMTNPGGASSAGKPATNAKSVTTLDIPVLPRKLVLDDADLRLRVRGVQGTRLPVGELGFDVRLRDGYMHSSPFFAEVAGARFDGALMLDLRDEPRIQLWLGAADVDVGNVLRQLKLVRDLEAGFGRFTLYLDSYSTRLSALMTNATLAGEITGGRLVLRDPGSGGKASLLVRQGTLTAKPGERLRMDISATLDQIPVELSMHTAPVKDLIDPSRRVPFELSVAAVNTHLSLSGTVDRDIDARDVELSMKLRGERLHQLDKLLRVSLPPWGPWSASGRFRMSLRGYEVDELQLKVGSSLLNGKGTLVTSSARPRLDITLNTPLIQLDDFRLQGWSATESAGAPADILLDQDSLRKAATEKSDQIQGLLSPATLKKIDASLAVRVERVLSGKDVLGGGELVAQLNNGRADIGPVRVDMPGGSAVWTLGYEPTDRDVMARLKIDVDNFDYGVLGRRIKPDTDIDGRFTLHANVSARAPRLSQILRHGSGKIDVAVWPKNLRSGVFDLWAVNVLTALLPTIDPANESKVNCALARFHLENGKLTQRNLVIDTTQMRVTGNSSADFSDEKLAMRLQPQAKSAQFLSLATPIEVSGTFSKFQVNVRPGDVVETVVRLATSIVWVPIKKLFSEKVPVDGSDVCVLPPAS